MQQVELEMQLFVECFQNGLQNGYLMATFIHMLILSCYELGFVVVFLVHKSCTVFNYC